MPTSACSSLFPPSLPVSPGPGRPVSQSSCYSDSRRPLSSLSADVSLRRPASQGWPRAHTPFSAGTPMSARGCYTHRDSSADSRCRISAGSPMGGMKDETEIVQPPWGAERANADFPPYEEVAVQRQRYLRILDAQAKLQRERERRRLEDDDRLEKKTLTGLEIHPVGVHRQRKALNAQCERAVYEEIRIAAVRRRESEREERDIARQDYKHWADQAELDFAQQWYAKRQEDRRNQMNLAAVWKSTADERRTREAKAREDELNADREVVQRNVRGMVQRRPMKRSKEKCMSGEPCLAIGSADPHTFR